VHDRSIAASNPQATGQQPHRHTTLDLPPARRADIIGTDTAENGHETVTATAPTAELTRYAVDLRALAGGRRSFSATYDHNDTVSEHLMVSTPGWRA